MNPLPPRVVHLTTVHQRDDVRIFRKQCRALAAAGFEVVEVVGDGLGPSVVDGIRIVDIGPRPSGRLARMRKQPVKALHAVRAERPALLHFHDPELLPVGVRLAAEGLPVIYDAHEDVPRQILTKQWLPAWLRPGLSRAFEVYENRQVRRLTAVCAATPHIARRFSAQAPQSVCIANYPLADELRVGESANPAPRERVVAYVGGIMRTRGAFEMVQALPLVPGVRLLLCGRFEDAALESALRAELGWAQVDYLGQVDRAGVARVLSRSQAGLVTLHPMPSYLDALPVKMFEYMAVGLPVVASDFDLWRSIVESDRAGICVDPMNPQAIAAAITRLLDDPEGARAMGERGRAAVLAKYRWDAEATRLVALYRSLLG